MDESIQQDPALIADFVTESRELIEAVDQDLVALERAPQDMDLLNRVFRALHTIKGSSSFLGFDALTRFTHAGEDALNALRKGEASLTADCMDILLQAVDIVRQQIDAIDDGDPPQPGPTDLIEQLSAVASSSASAGQTEDPDACEADCEVSDTQPRPLEISEAKRDLLPFMLEDLTASTTQLKQMLSELDSVGDRAGHVVRMGDLTAGLVRTAEFFEIRDLVQDVQTLDHFCDAAADLPAEALNDVTGQLAELIAFIDQRAAAIGEDRLEPLNTESLRDAIERRLSGEPAGEPAESSKSSAESTSEPAAATAASAGAAAATAGSTQTAERTIRVDVERLESLLNLVGELVLQKNRVLGLSRLASRSRCDQELRDQLVHVGSEIERVTADLQTGVMKTRMQPLNKLFNRFPRVVRDLARAMDKQIDLQIDGGETEVDKSVIESLGDPLVHILRNSADHGLEPSDQRDAAGKSPTGVIRLSACHEGNHVLVQIADDGRGLDAERIGRKAVERGLITAEQAQSMSPRELHSMIFQPGFSTAEQISDVSGRGVGMDVVRTNINRLNGMIEVDSEAGKGTTISIRIPLTVAIMRAMVVSIDDEVYALPLSNIVEIMRADEKLTYTVGEQPVMRVRDSVLPLVDLHDELAGTGESKPAGIVVIVGLGERCLGLRVHRLLGQEEVVIKPLEDQLDRHEAISGATIREDGSVSLILEVAALFRSVARRPAVAA